MNRNLGIDLARVLAIMMVVLGHIVTSGGMLEVNYSDWKTWIPLHFIDCLTCGCVDLFAVITGYLGACGVRHRLKSLFCLWIQVFSINAILCLIGYCLTGHSVLALKKLIFPVSTNVWWYFSAYFPLFFLMPICDAGVRILSQKGRLCVLVLCAVLLPFSDIIDAGDAFVLHHGYSFAWLLFCYLAGNCWYYMPRLKRSANYFVLFFLCVFVLFLEGVGLRLLPEIADLFHGRDPLRRYSSDVVLFGVMCLLQGCANIRISRGWLLPLLSQASFGVYLWHVHPWVWNSYWIGAFKSMNVYLVPIVFVGLYSVLVAIERARSLLFSWLGVEMFCLHIFDYITTCCAGNKGNK